MGNAVSKIYRIILSSFIYINTIIVTHTKKVYQVQLHIYLLLILT